MMFREDPTSSSEAEITYVDDGDRATFRLVGAFAAETAPLVRRAIAPHLTSGRWVCIDCARLQEIAPEVLSTIVACARLASAFDTTFDLENLCVAMRDALGGPIPNRAVVHEVAAALPRWPTRPAVGESRM